MGEQGPAVDVVLLVDVDPHPPRGELAGAEPEADLLEGGVEQSPAVAGAAVRGGDGQLEQLNDAGRSVADATGQDASVSRKAEGGTGEAAGW